jgi:endonuclease YncB( thermonuclease family)
LLLGFVDWVRDKGPVACHKHAQSKRYRCLTATGEDIAEAVLSGGVGRAAGGATLGYRNAEAQARQNGKGLWAKL